MMFIVFLFLIVIGMIIKKSKLYEILIIAFMAIITLYGENIADFENYQNAYNYIATGHNYTDLGKGWYYLCSFGAKLNLTYAQFKTIIMIISLLLIFDTIKYFVGNNKYKTTILSLYLIFPALLDCIQIRFLLAEAIVIFAFRYLFRNDKKSLIIYSLLVLLASTIHSSVLLYFIFLLYKFIGKYESKYLLLVTSFIVILALFRGYIIKVASLFINQRRIDRYFYSADTLGIKGLIIYSCIIILFYYISKMIFQRVKENQLKEEEVRFFQNILKLNILISVIIVFSLFDPNFFRLQRIMWIFMYISFVKLLNIGVKDIRFINIKMPVKLLSAIIAIIGNLVFISITTPEIITNLLL